MESQIAKVDFYLFIEMFSNLAMDRNLPTFHILSFPFLRVTDLIQKTLHATPSP